jgi:2-haloalkanoic acid dehalogenase type II
MAFDLTKSNFLAFDIYATLIDWESGISKQLAPLLPRLPESSPLLLQSPQKQRAFLLRRFAEIEIQIQTAEPALIYTAVLSGIYTKLAAELEVEIGPDDAHAFGQGIGEWEAYPDTVAAMQVLGKYYKLAPLSNVDKTSFNRTLTGPLKGVHFDALYLAEDIGSYKPSLNNFHYLIDHVQEEFGIEKMQICMVAQSLQHDHVPAKTMGMSPSVWISRGGDKSAMGSGNLEKYQEKVNLGAIYDTLGEMAEAVERAFNKEK